MQPLVSLRTCCLLGFLWFAHAFDGDLRRYHQLQEQLVDNQMRLEELATILPRIVQESAMRGDRSYLDRYLRQILLFFVRTPTREAS